MSKSYTYTAQDNLEVMKDAVNYNSYQCDFIEKEIKKFNNKSVKILDFGAGLGTFAEVLRARGYKIDCVEKDKNQAKVLTASGYKVYSDISKVKTKYDIIYSLNVLEHIKDDSKALTSLRTCLSKNGRIVIFVPAFMVIFTKLDVKAEHYRRYKIKQIKELADNSSLNISDVKYCDPVGFILALIYRIIGGDGNLNYKTIGLFDKYLFPLSVSLEPIFKKVMGKNVLAIFYK